MRSISLIDDSSGSEQDRATRTRRLLGSFFRSCRQTGAVLTSKHEDSEDRQLGTWIPFSSSNL